MGPTRHVLRETLGVALLVVFSCLVGALAVEAGYRVYLSVAYPQFFTPPKPEGYFAAYSVSHWEFDEEFGYVYPPGRVIDYTGVMDGFVKDCDRITIINKHGNIGPIVGDYRTAALKILVFGDSWTAFNQQSRTWTHYLQEILGRRLGKSVHVVNFGRDGYGTIQMFDLAAARIPEWKPDLVIFAFITDDLTRARIWRTVVGEGDAVRVLTTVEPVRNPDPARAADAFLLMPSATHEWCRSMAGTKRADATLERLIEKHHRLVAHNRGGAVPKAELFTLRRSYLYDRLMHGDAFRALRRSIPPSVNPRLTFSTYADDARFMKDLERIRAARIPWALFHFAIYPEIKSGREYILDRQQTALLQSLEAVTGKQVWKTTDYVRMPLSGPERLNVSEDNYHPSLWAMEFYAGAVAEALVRNGLVR